MKRKIFFVFGVLNLISAISANFLGEPIPDQQQLITVMTLVGILLITLAVRIPKHEKISGITKHKKVKKHEEKEQYFDPDKMITKTVGVDMDRRLIGVKHFRKFSEIWPLEEIQTYEIVENGQSISSGGIGSAVIGGMAFGGVGAITGAITGKKTQNKKVTTFRVKLNTNNIDKPVRYINLISGPTKSNSLTYKNAVSDADTIIASLNILMGKNERT